MNIIKAVAIAAALAFTAPAFAEPLDLREVLTGINQEAFEDHAALTAEFEDGAPYEDPAEARREMRQARNEIRAEAQAARQEAREEAGRGLGSNGVTNSSGMSGGWR